MRSSSTARQEGFDLEAGVKVPADQRDRLERLCRYALRPTVAQDWLQLAAEGQVVLQLRHPWSDGTTHLLLDPLELLERLAVLPVRLRSGHPERSRGVIPRPRINLILYHGVLPFDVAQGTPSKVEGWGPGRRGPSTLLRAIPSNVAGWRSLVVGVGNTANRGEASTADAPTAEERADSSEVSTTDAPTAGVRVDPREARATEPAPDPACERERRPPREEARRFADLMRRTFGLDVLACPRCGPSTLLRAIPSAIEGWWGFRLIALIEEAAVIERILRHLHLPTEVPAPRSGRAPPLDEARGALSRVEGRRCSGPARSTRTRTSRYSPDTRDRRAQVPRRRRSARLACGRRSYEPHAWQLRRVSANAARMSLTTPAQQP